MYHNSNVIMIDGVTVYKDDELWNHTKMRIENAEKRAKNYEQFVTQMVTRLKRITHKEKIYYAIAVLKEKRYDEVVDIYNGKLLIDEMSKYGGMFIK